MTTTESVDPPVLDIGSGWIDGEANKNCLPNVKKWTGRSIQNFSPPFKTGVIDDSSTSASIQFFHDCQCQPISMTASQLGESSYYVLIQNYFGR